SAYTTSTRSLTWRVSPHLYNARPHAEPRQEQAGSRDRAEQARAVRLFHRGVDGGRPGAAGMGGEEPAVGARTDHRGLRDREGRRGLAPRLAFRALVDHFYARRRRSDTDPQAPDASRRTRPAFRRRRAQGARTHTAATRSEEAHA